MCAILGATFNYVFTLRETFSTYSATSEGVDLRDKIIWQFLRFPFSI